MARACFVCICLLPAVTLGALCSNWATHDECTGQSDTGCTCEWDAKTETCVKNSNECDGIGITSVEDTESEDEPNANMTDKETEDGQTEHNSTTANTSGNETEDASTTSTSETEELASTTTSVMLEENGEDEQSEEEQTTPTTTVTLVMAEDGEMTSTTMTMIADESGDGQTNSSETEDVLATCDTIDCGPGKEIKDNGVSISCLSNPCDPATSDLALCCENVVAELDTAQPFLKVWFGVGLIPLALLVAL